MSAIAETSVIVRYLTLEPMALGRRAQQLVESDERLVVPWVALVEAAFVLTRLYGVERAVVVDLLSGFVSRANIAVLELPKPLVLESLALCRPSGRVSFADAFIWASARHSGVDSIYTFDHRFPAAHLTLRVLGVDQ